MLSLNAGSEAEVGAEGRMVRSRGVAKQSRVYGELARGLKPKITVSGSVSGGIRVGWLTPDHVPEPIAGRRKVGRKGSSVKKPGKKKPGLVGNLICAQDLKPKTGSLHEGNLKGAQEFMKLTEGGNWHCVICGDIGCCANCLELAEIPAHLYGRPHADVIARLMAAIQMGILEQQQQQSGELAGKPAMAPIECPAWAITLEE